MPRQFLILALRGLRLLCAEQFGLFQNSLRCLFLFVRRITVFAENALFSLYALGRGPG